MALKLNSKAFGEFQDLLTGGRGSLKDCHCAPKLPVFALCVLGWELG